MPPKKSDSKRQYDQHRERARQRSAERVLAGQEIAPLPPIANIERRAKADCDFRYFCETYFQDIFTLRWSPDHLKVINKIERVVCQREMLAVAMPRGSGKTSLSLAGTIWAIITGKHPFVYLIAGTNEAAVSMLSNIKSHFESNKLLLEDYPEAVYPIIKLGGETRRCAGQRYYGVPTQINWGAEEIVMPSIPESRCAGAIIRVSGITGHIRGALHTRPDGRQVRPTLVICDDPQTDQSARSIMQTAERLRIITGTILGLAGPGERTGAIVPCTVIQKNDLADQLLDKDKNPQWHGERTKLIYSLPENLKLWSEYAKIRDESLKSDGDGREATEFYARNRDAMDEGAVVAWEDRYLRDNGEISAVQHAMNLKFDRGDECFYAEYQNDPGSTIVTSAEMLTVEKVCGKANGRPLSEVPISCSRLTMFVDVHKTLLFYCVCGWEEGFTAGYIVEYGTYPKQYRNTFTLASVQRTLQDEFKGLGPNGSVQAGLEKLVETYVAKDFQRGNGLMKIDKVLVDMGWEPAQGIIAAVKHKIGSVMMMSKGMALGAAKNPMTTWKKRPGEVHGNHWYVPNVSRSREFPHILFDANYWKTFVQSGLLTPAGENGSITIFGEQSQHELFAKHVAEGEQWVDVHALGRTVRQWQQKPHKPDNHWFDCLVGCAVAASYTGIRASSDDQRGGERRAAVIPSSKIHKTGVLNVKRN